MRGHLLPLVLALATPAAPAGRPKLTAVQVEPAKFVLNGKWASQQLAITGRFSDGSVRDLTSKAQFKPANARIAVVDKAGLVKPAADGVTTLSIQVKEGGSKHKATVAVTVKDSRTAAATFVNHVQPLLNRRGCNSTECHGQRGKGGLRLSLFGGDPEGDFEALTKAGAGRRINRVEPLKSLLLAKATGAMPHTGAAQLEAGTPDYDMLVSWLVRAAPWSDPKEPRVVSLKLFPDARTLAKGESQQLLVTAEFSDGTRKDVTRDAVYKSSDARVAEVSAPGRLHTQDYGESAIVANYMRQAAVARIMVPQTPAQPFPALEANNRIDELVYAKLKTLGIPPSGLSTDQEFLRRAYLDAIGSLPTADEARAFLRDRDPTRRARLIDRLLEREEFADCWALKWGDLLRIKSEYPVRVWPKAVAVYYRWLHESIARNKPYDQFVRELLTANGSNFRVGPANFFRAVPSKDPRTIGETTALVFMGARVGCARCHGHPTERWTLEDDLGLGAFFSKVNFKSTLEWKEEIVYYDARGALRNPRSSEVVKPKFLEGGGIDVGKDEDPRLKFAEWLTSPENSWFARNIVNRIWYWLLGRGIVHEPDDLRATNPPENPELLEYLAQELIARRYDLKHIYRLILNSRTYQLSSTPNRDNARDAAHFSHYPVKRLTAEQLLDAISQVTEVSERFTSRIPEPFSNWPVNYRAAQISDGNTDCPFLDLFGRPPRDTPYEEERSSELSLRQALYFVNSEQLENKVAASPRLKRLLQPGKSDAEVIEELYLTTLSRFPTDEEKQKLVNYLVKNKAARPQALRDIVWAVLNTKEFMFDR